MTSLTPPRGFLIDLAPGVQDPGNSGLADTGMEGDLTDRDSHRASALSLPRSGGPPRIATWPAALLVECRYRARTESGSTPSEYRRFRPRQVTPEGRTSLEHTGHCPLPRSDLADS